MKILVKFPTRERPERFLEYLRLCVYNQKTDDVYYLVSIDVDDLSMNDNVVTKAMEITDKIRVVRGTSTCKIHACNRDITDLKYKWDILILASDDMQPVAEGWDSIIIHNMRENYPDTDGVLWFNDGYTQERLNTMCIMGRVYYERFGYIYHTDYTSLWADNEFMEVSKKLGKVRYFPQVLFRHEHPANNGKVMDSLYVQNEKHYTPDREVYEKRKSVNFGL